MLAAEICLSACSKWLFTICCVFIIITTLSRLATRNPTLSLSELAAEVANCTLCPLHKTRRNTVFSRGNPQAKLMLIGEAPGFHEDQQGQPFVGRAGILLQQMMASVGMDDQNFYIANVLKCRPPNNRDPRVEEINQCRGYLSQQIDLVQPGLILALGRFAGQFLYGQSMALKDLRGTVHDYLGIPFMVSYHPAYLLRNPRDKKKSYTDLVTAKHWLQERNYLPPEASASE